MRGKFYKLEFRVAASLFNGNTGNSECSSQLLEDLIKDGWRWTVS
jgi:hypothetical protein